MAEIMAIENVDETTAFGRALDEAKPRFTLADFDQLMASADGQVSEQQLWDSDD